MLKIIFYIVPLNHIIGFGNVYLKINITLIDAFIFTKRMKGSKGRIILLVMSLPETKAL